LSAGSPQQAGVEHVLASQPLQQQPDFICLLPEIAENMEALGQPRKNPSRSMTADFTYLDLTALNLSFSQSAWRNLPASRAQGNQPFGASGF